MSVLSQGPYNYNRFSAMDELYANEKRYFTEKAKEKKAKPDFLDVDGDGDKEESFKKGVKDKEKGEGKKEMKENRQTAYSAGESEGKKSMKSRPAKITGGKTYTMKGKDGKPLFKEAKCSSGCDCDDCKKDKKKAMNEWIEELVQEGYDLSQYNMEQMEEMYDAALEEALEESNPTIQEAICQYLMDNGFANNTVSAEVLFSNMSEGWRDDVVNQLTEGPALNNTIKTLQDKVGAMNSRRPGSAHQSRNGKQSPAAALYKAHQRGGV